MRRGGGGRRDREAREERRLRCEDGCRRQPPNTCKPLLTVGAEPATAGSKAVSHRGAHRLHATGTGAKVPHSGQLWELQGHVTHWAHWTCEQSTSGMSLFDLLRRNIFQSCPGSSHAAAAKNLQNTFRTDLKTLACLHANPKDLI